MSQMLYIFFSQPMPLYMSTTHVTSTNYVLLILWQTQIYVQQFSFCRHPDLELHRRSSKYQNSEALSRYKGS